MIAELRQKSQITIPKALINKFSLHVGDKLDVIEKDGMICLIPVVVYPKDYIDDLKSELKEVRLQLQEGTAPAYDTVDALIDSLEQHP